MEKERYNQFELLEPTLVPEARNGPQIGSSDVKFEPRGPALVPKSDPTGLLPGLNASCWAHAGINSSSPMLKGYTVGLDAGYRNECWA